MPAELGDPRAAHPCAAKYFTNKGMRYNLEPKGAHRVLVGRHYRVQGRVQGVGFRYFVERAARLEGLSGFVRNLEDGGVEVVVEGDADGVARFEAQLRHGPPLARVEDVEVTRDPPTGRMTGFSVRS